MVQRNGFQAKQIVSLCFCVGEMKGGRAPYMCLWRLGLAAFLIFTPFYRINDSSSIMLWTGGRRDGGGASIERREGGVDYGVEPPEWISLVFLFGTSWQGLSHCTQPCPSPLSISKTLRPQILFYFCPEDCFYFLFLWQTLKRQEREGGQCHLIRSLCRFRTGLKTSRLFSIFWDVDGKFLQLSLCVVVCV